MVEVLGRILEAGFARLIDVEAGVHARVHDVIAGVSHLIIYCL